MTRLFYAQGWEVYRKEPGRRCEYAQGYMPMGGSELTYKVKLDIG